MSIKVAIQGIKGCFHEEAAYKYFGDDIETIECESFKKTCELLKQGEVDHVVMAIENSIAGGLLPNHSLLRDYRFPIIGEVYLHVKLHLLVTQDGHPVEFFLTPGSVGDVSALKMYDFDVPEGAWVTADKAYTDYRVEDVFEAAGRQLSPLRKKNSLRPKPAWVGYMQETYRKVIETTGSRIEHLLPKHIHSVTSRGFELKVGLFVLAASFTCLHQ